MIYLGKTNILNYYFKIKIFNFLSPIFQNLIILFINWYNISIGMQNKFVFTKIYTYSSKLCTCIYNVESL